MHVSDQSLAISNIALRDSGDRGVQSFA